MDFSGLGTTLMVILGPLLLVGVIAWAMLRNRKSRTPVDVTEAGARRVYEQEERERARKDDAAR